MDQILTFPILKHVCNVSCSICRDVLPFTLKLPEAISAAKTPTDLEQVAQLGKGEFLLNE